MRKVSMILTLELGMLSAWLLLTWSGSLEIYILSTQVLLESLYFTMKCT